jgi:hypothetical protein
VTCATRLCGLAWGSGTGPAIGVAASSVAGIGLAAGADAETSGAGSEKADDGVLLTAGGAAASVVNIGDAAAGSRGWAAGIAGETGGSALATCIGGGCTGGGADRAIGGCGFSILGCAAGAGAGGAGGAGDIAAILRKLGISTVGGTI